MLRPAGCIAVLLGLFLLAGPVHSLGPAWSGRGGAPVVVSADGKYVLSDGDTFTLFGPGGTVTWRGFGGSSVLSNAGGFYQPLALTRDGMFSVVGTNGGLLYLDRTQRIFWQDSRYRPIGGVALSPDENFVAVVADGHLSVYTRGGDVVWRNSTYPDVQSVAISRDGLLSASGAPGVIHAFNASGFELWNYTAPGIGKILVSPADSDILAVSDYTVLALHPSGNLLWSFYTGSAIRDLALSWDGSSIAVGNQGGEVYLLDRNGNQAWVARLSNWANAVSISDDGSLVAAGDIDRTVYLFDRNGNQLWNYTTGGIVGGVALSGDGSSLAAASDQVYFFDLAGPGTVTTTPSLVTTQGTTPPVPSLTTTGPAGGNVLSPSPTAPPATTPASGSGEFAIIAAGAMAFAVILKRVN